MTSRRPALRVSRGLLTGTICGLGAVAAHHLAGGDAAPAAMAVIWPASVLIGICLAGPRVRPSRLTAAVAVTQGAWHLLLVLIGPSAPEPGMHAHHQGAADDSSVPMMLAHGVVAALTLLLACGADRTVLTLLGAWLWPAIPSTAPLVVRARLAQPFRQSHVLVVRIGRSSWSVRGPPAAAVI